MIESGEIGSRLVFMNVRFFFTINTVQGVKYFAEILSIGTYHKALRYRVGNNPNDAPALGQRNDTMSDKVGDGIVAIVKVGWCEFHRV